jgi:hypothetical protein
VKSLVPNLNETVMKHETFVNLDAPNDWISCIKWCAYFVKPSMNGWIIIESNITSYQCSETIVWNMKPLWNLDAPNGSISRTKECAYFVKPSINEWIIIENNITLYQSSVKLLCETSNLCETSMLQMDQFLVPNNAPTLWNYVYTSEPIVTRIKPYTKPQ